MVYYKCDSCNAIFDKKSTFTYHIYLRKTPCKTVQQEIQDYEKIKNSPKLTCSLCYKTYSSISNLNKHTRRSCKPSNSNIIRNLQNNPSPNRSAKLTNIAVNNDSLKGLSGSRASKQKWNLSPHKTDINPSQNNNRKDLTLTGEELDEFIDDFDEMDNIIMDDDKDVTSLSCSYCKKDFSRRDNLIRHIDNYCKNKKKLDIAKDKIFKDLVKREVELQLKDIRKENRKRDEESRKQAEENRKQANEIKSLKFQLAPKNKVVIFDSEKDKVCVPENNNPTNTSNNFNSGNYFNNHRLIRIIRLIRQLIRQLIRPTILMTLR